MVTTETGVEALLLAPVALLGDWAAVEVSIRPPEIRVVAPPPEGETACGGGCWWATSLGLSRGLLLLQGGLTWLTWWSERFCGYPAAAAAAAAAAAEPLAAAAAAAAPAPKIPFRLLRPMYWESRVWKLGSL